MSEPAPVPAPSHSFRADGVLLLITAWWGLSFVIIKDALAQADTWSFLVVRFALAGLVTTALAGRRLLDRTSVRNGMKLSVLLWLGYALQTYGLNFTTPSRSSFITGLCVVLVPFVSLVLYRRAPKAASLVGVGLALLGLWLLTFGPGSAASTTATLTGDLLTLGCAVAYAFHITLNERYAQQSHATALVATQMWGVVLLSLAPLAVGPRHFSNTPSLWGALLLTAIVGSAGAILLQTWAQARTTAVRAALIFTLEPVVTAVFSSALGREQLGLREGLGGGLIVAGVLVAEVGGVLLERRRAASGSANAL